MAILNKFLFCLPLKIGGFVIGVVNATISMALCFLTILDLFNLGIKEEDKNELHKLFKTIHDRGVDPDHKIIIPAFDLVDMLLSLNIFIYIFVLFTSILLIFGTKKHKENLIFPYLLANALGIAARFLDIILLLIAYNLPLLISITVIYIVIWSYSWVCIFALYESVSEDNLQRRYHGNVYSIKV